MIDDRAKLIAQKANECCYRSDGFEEDIKSLAKELISNAVLMEREECAKLVDEIGLEVYCTESHSRQAAVNREAISKAIRARK